jgi:predicted component of type VI protein secretion system
LKVPGHPTTFEASTEHNQRYFKQWEEMAASTQEWAERYEPRVRAFGYSLQNLEIR